MPCKPTLDIPLTNPPYHPAPSRPRVTNLAISPVLIP
jgi:hypothetical protein